MAFLYSRITLALLLSSVSCSPIVARSPIPPNIPSSSSATTLLNGLTVTAQGAQTGYSRDLFPTWNTISGTCNTRETVLQRDGTGVVVNSACTATSGSWFSPYDGATWTAASDVDIDHVVPLSNAWKVDLYPLYSSRYHADINRFPVWSCSLDNSTATGICQRSYQPSIDRSDGQRQPGQIRFWT